MNIFRILRERIGAVIASVFAAIAFCICGLMFTFFLAPRQALEARRIGNLPQMDASYVTAAAPGDDILITGSLQDNPLLLADSDLVAYHLEEWEVRLPDADEEGDREPTGLWNTLERVVPDLNLDVGGQNTRLLAATDVTFSGAIHEELILGEGTTTANYDGQPLPHGSWRYRGFFNGDLITVLGTKASADGVIPEKMYAGDRVAFEQSEEDAAQGLLIGGIVLMACAPLVLVGGVLGAIFGRRRRGFRLR